MTPDALDAIFRAALLEACKPEAERDPKPLIAAARLWWETVDEAGPGLWPTVPPDERVRHYRRHRAIAFCRLLELQWHEPSWLTE